MPLIAVVDDRVTNRNILTKLATLAGRGHRRARLRRSQGRRSTGRRINTPDLVITDYKMPKLDGAEFVRQFRKLPLCFDVPVVVVTVYEDRDFRYKALEAGATDFLISPVDHHEFRTRVRNLLTLRRQQEIIRKRALTLGGKAGADQPAADRGAAGKPRASEPCHRHGAGDDLRHQCRGHCVFVNNSQCDFFRIDAQATPRAGRSAELFGEDYAHRHRDLDAQVFATGRVQFGLRGGASPSREGTSARLPDHQGAARAPGGRGDQRRQRLPRHHGAQAGRAFAGPGQGRGGIGQSQQDRVPGQHQPRAAHAAERHHRLRRDDEDGDAGAHRQSPISRICRRHPGERPASAADHRRPARHVAHRGGRGEAARKASSPCRRC